MGKSPGLTTYVLALGMHGASLRVLLLYLRTTVYGL